MSANTFRVALLFWGALFSTAGCYTRRSEPFRGPLDHRTTAIDNGELKFNRYCQPCHPSGEAGLAPELNALPAPRFLIAFQIRHGLGAMPAFKPKVLSKKDMWDITRYIKAMKHNDLER